jgi:hypothetical protein
VKTTATKREGGREGKGWRKGEHVASGKMREQGDCAAVTGRGSSVLSHTRIVLAFVGFVFDAFWPTCLLFRIYFK